MRKKTIIEHDQFKQIIQYNPAVKGKYARNHLKMQLLNSLIEAIGEKWYRLKSETKSAFEYLCFLSIERGFVYAGYDHLGGRYNIDSSTIRRYIPKLEKEGVIRRLWRSSTKHNGRGKAVLFFTEHPYYKKYWEDMFFCEKEAQTDTQAGHVHHPSKINKNDRKNDPTLNLPYLSKNLLNKRYNGNETEFTSNRVPVQFKQLASNFYHKADTIEELWKVVKCATHKLNYSISEVADLACDGFRQLIRVVKHGQVKKSIYACYWGIVNNILDQMYLKELAEMDRKMGISIDDYKLAFNPSL